MDNLLLVQHICTAQFEIQIYQINIEASSSSSTSRPYLLVWLTLNVDEPNAFVLELLFFHGEIVCCGGEVILAAKEKVLTSL